jgi:hypothetical protein
MVRKSLLSFVFIFGQMLGRAGGFHVFFFDYSRCVFFIWFMVYEMHGKLTLLSIPALWSNMILGPY